VLDHKHKLLLFFAALNAKAFVLKQSNLNTWGCHPKPAILFVLTQKVFKKVKAYDAFTTIYSACFCHAILAAALRDCLPYPMHKQSP
jgi:hypothetical protein